MHVVREVLREGVHVRLAVEAGHGHEVARRVAVAHELDGEAGRDVTARGGAGERHAQQPRGRAAEHTRVGVARQGHPLELPDGPDGVDLLLAAFRHLVGHITE